MFNFFWVGSELTKLEIACLNSHINVGHHVNLWCYKSLYNVPEGVVLKDASLIMPHDEVFFYKLGDGKGSYSACSNIFRYKCLYEMGGYWVDIDVFAIKTFDFKEEYLFASECDRKGNSCITSCVIKCPKGSEIMKWCYEQSILCDREIVMWGEIGPKMLANGIMKFNLEHFVRSRTTFCPLNWTECENKIDQVQLNLFPDTSGVHLWNEMWRRNSIDKNDNFINSKIYGKLNEN